jgi:hypothetical protein
VEQENSCFSADNVQQQMQARSREPVCLGIELLVPGARRRYSAIQAIRQASGSGMNDPASMLALASTYRDSRLESFMCRSAGEGRLG